MTIVSRETAALRIYAAMIRKWNPTINLISPSTVDQIESRHILDSEQMASISSQATGSWLDLGSGGGFPGVVMAILRPDLDVVLVESDQRKCSFLRAVIREVGLPNASVYSERIEVVKPLEMPNVSARALAPLPRLMSYVERHLGNSGKAWLMKGRNWQSEVVEAQKIWHFDYKSHQSHTDPDAAILEITGVRHA